MQKMISKTETPPRAMLAKRYTKMPKGVTCWSQAKLDGVRCLATSKGLWSRSGLKISSCSHIEVALHELFIDRPDLILDGELYSHQLRDDLGAIIGLVNRQSPQSGSTLSANSASLSLHVFDIADVTAKFSERLARCRELAASFKSDAAVRFVPTTEVIDPAMLDALYEDFLNQGFEGQIIRTDEVYIGARSSRLLKRKPFEDAEFVLTALELIGSERRTGLRALLKTGDGFDFAAVVEGAVNLPTQGLSPDAKATVRFAGRSKNNIPRCARVVAVHPNGRSL